MSLILQKFKEIKEELPSIKDKYSVINVHGRVIALVNRQYGSTSTYAKRLKGIEYYLNLTSSLGENVKTIEGVLSLVIDDLELKDHGAIIATRIVDNLKQKPILKKKVFIVHGHNETMKQSVARFIENIGLEAIILSEQVNNGKTIIEKFDLNANVDFAIILLSADDKGYSVKDGSRKARYRARQNVIFELGYFIAKFNREKVVALFENIRNFEAPSDLHGVVYTPFDGPDGAWKASLLKELKANGFDIDSNKVF